MECIVCKKESWKSKYCWDCRDKKQNASSIVSQNKKKLKKLMNDRELTPERLDKFILYSNNIIEHWKIVIKYREQDTRTTFERIMQYWTIGSLIMSLVFITEIIITEL